MDTVDVVVVGVGGMGAAAMMHLAARGLSVVGIEQHDVPHALGSSHGRARVIRKVYFEDPRYVPLLERSYELWRELERESGRELVRLVGCVNLGNPEHPLVRAVVDNARAHHLPHEILDARAVCERFPAFRLEGPLAETVGVYEADAGVVSVELCTRAHVDVALRSGAQLHVGERVLDVRFDGERAVTVVTDRRTIAAGAVVFAGGPWSPQLPGLASSSLWAQRQVQCWFTPPDERFGLGQFPVFIHFLDDDDASVGDAATGAGARAMKTAGGRGAGDPGRAYYGMPPWGGGGVKIARHGGGARTTPDDVDRVVHDADVDDVCGYVKQALPDLDGPACEGEVCMYTMTPDGHFVVGNVRKNAVVLAGFSGHGYKMASVMGEIAADLVASGKTKHDIAFFDPFRFTSA